MKSIRTNPTNGAPEGDERIRTEPIVILEQDEFVVPCPFCDESHTHKGTCRLSQMNTGNVYVIVAKRSWLDVGRTLAHRAWDMRLTAEHDDHVRDRTMFEGCHKCFPLNGERIGG